MTTLMHDHPGWATADGTAIRVMRCGPTPWLLTWTSTDPDQIGTAPLADPGAATPVVDRVTPTVVHGVLAAVNTTVASVGTVLRVRNGDLWDAIGTAIIRQVIRAGQARQMYARFCQARGEPVSTPHGTRYLFPTAQTITDLPAQAFTTLGMAFKHRPLLAAADAVLTHGSTWAQLDPPALAEALQAVPRIGPWTAGAAVADYTGDFACYPYADLAVRTWTRRAAPHIDWPADEPGFAALWRRGAGDHLSALTLLTLAWGGTHVRSP